MKEATIQKPWIDTLFRGTKVVKLVSYLRLEFNIDFISYKICSKSLFWMWNHKNYSRKFWDNSNCKCDQGKSILDGIEFRVSKIIYKDIYIKEHGVWDCGLVRTSMLLSILRSTIVANAFSSDLETHKSQYFPMIAPRGVPKLSTPTKVTIFPPPVPYNFISGQCLKGDCWTTLFLRNSIVSMDLQSPYFERRNLRKLTY